MPGSRERLEWIDQRQAVLHATLVELSTNPARYQSTAWTHGQHQQALNAIQAERLQLAAERTVVARMSAGESDGS